VRMAALQVPRKRPRRRVASSRPRPSPTNGANQVSAYDFVFDACANGQQLKCLTVGARSLKAPANVCLQLRPIFIYKRRRAHGTIVWLLRPDFGNREHSWARAFGLNLESRMRLSI
jgi:hypothetical protein